MEEQVHIQYAHKKEVEAKKMKCEHCEKSFKTNIALKVHLEIVHHAEKTKNEKNEQNKCGNCSKTFIHSSQLRFHISHQKCFST